MTGRQLVLSVLKCHFGRERAPPKKDMGQSMFKIKTLGVENTEISKSSAPRLADPYSHPVLVLYKK